MSEQPKWYTYPSSIASTWSQLSVAIPTKITAEDVLSQYSGNYETISASLNQNIRVRSYDLCTETSDTSSACPLTTDVHHTSSTYSGVVATWMTSDTDLLGKGIVIHPAVADAANGATPYVRPYQFTPNTDTGGGGGSETGITGALIASVYKRDQKNPRLVSCRVITGVEPDGTPIYGDTVEAYMLDF